MITDWIIVPYNNAFAFSVTHRASNLNLLGPWNPEYVAGDELPELDGHLFRFHDIGNRRDVIRATFPSAVFWKNWASFGDLDVALIRLAAH